MDRQGQGEELAAQPPRGAPGVSRDQGRNGARAGRAHDTEGQAGEGHGQGVGVLRLNRRVGRPQMSQGRKARERDGAARHPPCRQPEDKPAIDLHLRASRAVSASDQRTACPRRR